MSRSVDVFINSPLELDQLADRLGELAGASVTSAPDGHRFEWNDGQVVASLGTHQYVDDGNLRLSRFPYVFSSRVGTNHLLASPELAMAREVADLVSLRLGSSALVVQDLERRDAGEPAGETAS